MSIIAMYLVFSMLAVMVSDATRYIIPNWLVGSLLLLYPVAVYINPQAFDWPHALLGMLLMFIGSYIAHGLRLMGAGDAKLLVACALWVGLKQVPTLLFLVAIIGGALALTLWLLRKLLPWVLPSVKLPRLFRQGEPMAYGLAIAPAFLLLLRDGSVLGSW